MHKYQQTFSKMRKEIQCYLSPILDRSSGVQKIKREHKYEEQALSAYYLVFSEHWTMDKVQKVYVCVCVYINTWSDQIIYARNLFPITTTIEF
jgi:hypothetical protein